MKVFIKIAIIAIILAPITIGACKKQPKCGCDKDRINVFEGVPVSVYYDTLNKSAQFKLIGDPYASYYFCNPTEMMDKLINFSNGDEALIDCDIFWECNYMMQASNNYYYASLYKVYMVTVHDVREDLYGK